MHPSRLLPSSKLADYVLRLQDRLPDGEQRLQFILDVCRGVLYPPDVRQDASSLNGFGDSTTTFRVVPFPDIDAEASSQDAYIGQIWRCSVPSPQTRSHTFPLLILDAPDV